MAEYAKNKYREENAASFRGVLSDIEASGKDVRQATDKIRSTVMKLCGRQVQKVKDANEAAQVVAAFKASGWQYVWYNTKNGVVEAEGALVHVLKQSGSPYCQKKPRMVEEEDHGLRTRYIRLCFGKIDSEWQFYLLDFWEEDGSPYDDADYATHVTIDQVKKDYLSYIMEELPIFLVEYSAHLKEKRRELENQSEKTEKIATEIISNIKKE